MTFCNFLGYVTFAKFCSISDLRKHARHLENEIDLKLVAFSKLGAGIKSPSGHAAPDKVPLLSGEDTFDTMALEIQELLTKVCFK